MVLLPSMAVTVNKEPIAWGFLGLQVTVNGTILC